MNEAIFRLLRQHMGRESAITAPEIARQLDTNEREVRRIIAAHCSQWSREVGTPLLAAPGGGFFFATEDEEIIRRYRLLLSVELEAKTKRKDFEKVCADLGLFGILDNKGAAA